MAPESSERARAGVWGERTIVDTRAGRPVVLGEMAEVRRRERARRRARRIRRLWPLAVLLLLATVVLCTVLLAGPATSFDG